MAQANIKAVITAEDRASGALKQFGSSVEKLGAQTLNVAKRASQAFGVAAVAATTFAVKSAADFEQTRIGLENMLGSADAARKMLGKVSKFAAETPFEFPELAQATRQLVAFGFSGEDAFKTMTQLGDVSAAIGAPINDLAYLMGTLRAQGRAFTIDIRQFAMRGIPIYEYLAKVMKTNTKELTGLIEAGKIGFPEVQKAFQLMTAEGGKFHGTMAKQSKSLSGLFSTLKDSIGQTARELVGITQEGDIKEGSLFDKLRKGTAWLIDNLPKLINQMKEIVRDIVPQLQHWARNVVAVATAVANYLMPKLEALWNTVRNDLWPAIKNVVLTFGPTVGAGLVWALGLAIDAINGIIKVLTPLQNWLSRNKEITWGLVGAWAALKTALMIGGLIRSITALFAVMSGAQGIGGVTTAIAGKAGLSANLLKLSAAGGPFAIAAAAGVGAAVAIALKWGETRNVIRQTSANIKKSVGSIDDAMSSLQRTLAGLDQAAAGRAQRTLQRMGVPQSEINKSLIGEHANYAAGTNYHPGGMAMVGEQGPELVNLPRGSSVTPNHKLGSTVNINISAGAFMGSEVEARKYANKILEYLKDSAASKGMSLNQMMGM